MSELRVTTDERVRCAVVPWTWRGRAYRTIVVKACFAVAPEADAALLPPAPIAREDRPHGGIPSRSLAAASELAPYLPQCDVLLVGHARTPRDRPGPSVAVRLGLARAGRPLLDKTVHVYGDRRGGGPPAPFSELPLVWERALGGPGEANPVGSAEPNLVDPVEPRRPAGLGPLSPFWPERKRALGGADRRALASLELPEEAPWAFFQAAPADQRIGFLEGGEWLVLDGVSAEHPRIRTRLPALRGVARVAADGRAADVPLACDTLAIDADRLTLTLLWRGHVPAPAGELEVQAALAAPGEAPRWGAAEAGVAAEPSAADPAAEGTLALDAEAPRAEAMPFAVGSPDAGERAASRAGTPWGAPLAPQPAGGAGEATLAVEPARTEGTLALDGVEERPSFPFPLPSGPPSTRLAPAIAGAPWSAAPAAPVTPAAPGEETLAVDGDVGRASRPWPGLEAPPADPKDSAGQGLEAPPADPTDSAGQGPKAPPAAAPAPAPALPAPPPAPAPPPKPPPRRDPDALVERLGAAGASADDLAALLRALHPPTPPPPED